MRADLGNPGVQASERIVGGVPVPGQVRQDRQLGIEPDDLVVRAEAMGCVDSPPLEFGRATELPELREHAAQVLVAADHRFCSVESLRDLDARLQVGEAGKVAMVDTRDALGVQQVGTDLVEIEIVGDRERPFTESDRGIELSAQHREDGKPADDPRDGR